MKHHVSIALLTAIFLILVGYPTQAASFTFTPIDFPGAVSTRANGIAPGGRIVGTYGIPGVGFFGFLDNKGAFSTITPGFSTIVFANGIEPGGRIVGAVGDQSDDFFGFLDDKGVFSTIVFPGAEVTEANGIEPGGRIVGQYQDNAGNTHGFLDNKGVFSRIDFPGAIFTSANGIASDGKIVGMYQDGNGMHGFLATPSHCKHRKMRPPQHNIAK